MDRGAAAHRDGSATAIRARDGDRIRLPGTYLATHAHLAYATTAHRGQGMTVDRCHAFIDGTEGHHLLYVAATRGRESNRLWVGLDTPHRKVLPGSPITVLLDILHRQDERRCAATAIRDDPPALMLARR